MNGESIRPRTGAFAGEPVRTEFDFSPSTTGWLPPPRLERGRPDFGIDAPGAVLRAVALATAFGSLALAATAVAGARIAYARSGKIAHRDALLATIAWTGNERVLDIGTGAGLYLLGAAARLESGKAVGVDVWRSSDLTANTRESTMRNAYFCGLVDRIEIRYEDARKLSTCTRNSFDIVFASMALHAIADAAGRDLACREIARVLRPGGRAYVIENMRGDELVRSLDAHGLSIERDTTSRFRRFAFVRTIVASKPVVTASEAAASKST